MELRLITYRELIQMFKEAEETQQLIMSGKICPYCKNETEYINSLVIYGKS
jgi:succinyl-CoA synthetase alpha subunit